MIFDHAVDAIERATGQRLSKRVVQALAGRAACDVGQFYAQRPRQPGAAGDALVRSCDGKGIVMRPEALRASTRTAAAKASRKLTTRLSKGEKRNRKRMAEVGAVDDATPAPRTPADILASSHQERPRRRPPGPTTHSKWLVASVTDDAAKVVAQAFDEADRRDPAYQRRWVALVDGNNHQIDRSNTEARHRGVPVTIVVDFVHVLEYLWQAAWCCFAEGDPAAEAWVGTHGLRILQGRASHAAAIRRKATHHGLDSGTRRNADTCANYLRSKRPYLDDPTALRQGWPIATGVIEGACRHLVNDRMDLTGARWGLPGAEAILKLRALRSNGDFEDYWAYHLAQEQRRIHEARYADGVIPAA